MDQDGKKKGGEGRESIENLVMGGSESGEGRVDMVRMGDGVDFEGPLQGQQERHGK